MFLYPSTLLYLTSQQIHQPSAMLFQRFNRLLFLAKGGRTVYFGEVGKNSSILRNYLEANGANPCPADANPAEWMLEVIGAAPGTATEIDWPAVWRASPEYQATRGELQRLKETRPRETESASASDDKSLYNEFAAPGSVQLLEVLQRVFQQYWRTPSYIYSKMALCVASVRCKCRISSSYLLTLIGYVHWVFLFRRRHQSTRAAKSNVLGLHALHHLRSTRPTNHAPFRHPTFSI